MAQHCAPMVVYYSPTLQNGWLQSIGATFRNAASNFAVSSHLQGWNSGNIDLRDPVDNCNGRDGGGDDGGYGDADDDSCWWSQWLGTDIGLRVLKNRHGGQCLRAGL